MSKYRFSKEEIEKYKAFTNENILPLDEIKGKCHQCGEILKDVELPEGPEREVVCLRCLDDFTANYLELKKEEDF